MGVVTTVALLAVGSLWVSNRDLAMLVRMKNKVCRGGVEKEVDRRGERLHTWL